MSKPLRLLVLFQGTWEDECVTALQRERRIELYREGFESFGYPHVFRLLGFDARRWVRWLVRRYRGRIDAVWSNDDGFGCLLAAMVARELGLPGADPAAIVRAQHKLVLRRTLAAALPAATVRAEALPWPFADRRSRDPRALAAAVAATGLGWPLFAKPVKGTFSALARRVADPDQLAAHLSLSRSDRWMFGRQSRPFAQLASEVLPLPCAPDHVLLEQPLAGVQVNVDGYADRGALHLAGIVDELMYPGEVQGARHFAGFTLPSRLPAAVQDEVARVALGAVRAVGYDHGLFNVELFVLPDGGVRVIEINPRSAGQFATMYRAVAGLDLELLAMALAAGRPATEVARLQPTAGAAASFVFRRFDGRPGVEPGATERAWLQARHPASRLWTEPCSAAARRREYRWLGSLRYAVWNHAAADFATLCRDGEEVAQRLFGVALPVA
ncbi:MAG: ATP-grasp domain-containing protein [Planctomycetes bacterium]|jgi:hypothetical protein|nr:ATP-grasp domain-containing protein [Planctomycetota bacterium]